MGEWRVRGCWASCFGEAGRTFFGKGTHKGDVGELAACVGAASLLKKQAAGFQIVQRQGMMTVPHAAERVGKVETESEPLQSAAGVAWVGVPSLARGGKASGSSLGMK